MKNSFKTLLCATALASVFGGTFTLRAVELPTYRYDQSNVGVNPTETSLTPADITTTTFRKLYSTPVDSKIYTQPLYVPGVVVTGGAHPGTHNLVIVGTQGDILYAIDAATGVIVWQTSFLLSGLPGATTITPVPASDSQDLYNATPTIGILGTPVIDSTTNMLYVLVKTKQIISGVTPVSFVNTLYKIDITNGATSATGAPLNIVSHNDYAVTTTSDDATYTYRTDPNPSVVQDPFTVGTGDGYITVGTQNRVYFNALRCLHRSALILANGNIYACFASAVGIKPYHGWMLGFDKGTLAMSSVTNLTPNAYWGGIWASGCAPAVDSSGNIFLALGNGFFDGTIAGGLNAQGFPVNGDYGDCLVKLAVDTTTSPSNQNVNGWGMKVLDYFTPSDNQALLNGDLDLGCGGIVLLPDSYGSTAHPHLLVTAGKEGTVYLLDRDSLGKFSPVDKSVQELLTPALLQNWSTPALFNGTFYYAGENDYGKAFSIANGTISTTPIKTPDTFGLRGATSIVSANGTTHGVVWMISSAYAPTSPAQLRAYSAANFANEIWTSDLAANSRDALGIGVKFSVPTVADGRVFVGAATSLVAYGLNPAAVVITSDPPPATAAVGTSYNFTFTAAGTPSPVFAVSVAPLPPGLSLSSTGVLSGTPTTPGIYSATVIATGGGLTPATQSFTITVSGTLSLANPIACWSFNEGTGTTAADSSGNGNSGTLFNSPAWVAGVLGDALSFNGISSHVSLNNGSTTGTLKPTLPVTISAWVKPTNTTGVQQIFSSDDWTIYAGYALQIIDGHIDCSYGTAAGNAPTNRRSKGGTTTLVAGKWYFVTAVIGGWTSMSLYVNGVDDGGTYDGTGGTMRYTTAPSEIGEDGPKYPYNGVIDDLRVYNRALSPTEIELLANGPVSNWRFDEGTGTTAIDSGTAGMTGTLVNSPTYTQGWFGNALNFNGISSHVSLNNGSTTGTLKPTLPVTISAWVKPTNTTGVQQIFSSDDWTIYAGYALQIIDGHIDCSYGTAAGNAPTNRRSKGGTTTLVAGKWYFVTAVIGGWTSMSLYVNGVDDGGTYDGTGGTMRYTTAPSEIGEDGPKYPYNGVIDDLRVYNRALSPAEVQTLSSAKSGPIAPE